MPCVWGEHYARDFALSVLEDQRQTSLVHALKGYCHHNEWSWSSGCSGTDSPAWMYKGVKEALISLGVVFVVDHIASCEICPKKRGFIRVVVSPPPKELYACVFDATRDEAHDFMSGTVRRCDADNASRTWIIGFSCKSGSGLNAHRPENFIQERAGSTGIWWL